MRDPFVGTDFSQNSQRHRASRPAPTEPEVGSLPDESASDHESVKETGTTTIGISTTDGVVVATDMRASLGGRFVSNKTVQKVEQIHPTAALTLVGSVGGAQSFIRTLRAEVNLFESRRGEDMSMQALSTLAGNFARGGPFLAINPILGGVDEEGSHVYSIEARDTAVAAIRAAAERDTGSGNGVYIAEVTGDGVEIESHENFEGV
ncbi:proteasome subunit beta [Halobacteriales archaeon QH_3_68_24]|nr:MAG: proteasome subunit beta [Halobacteriales archaeon QH_3_68_24]